MKKVVQFIHGLSMGGAETLVKDYCLFLDKEKIDLTLVCLKRLNSPYEKLLEKNHVKIIYISDFFYKHQILKNNTISKIQKNFFRYYYTARVLRQLKPDILHSHLPVNLYIWVAHLPRTTKLFHTVHSEPYRYWGVGTNISYKIDKWALHKLIKKYDLTFIALHERMRLEINQMFDVKNTIVLNNGIDFSKYEKRKPKKIVRTELGISEDAFVVGHVGRFIAIKNHDFLLDVFKEIAKKNQSSVLLLIGAGETKKHILERVKQEHIPNKIIFLENRTDIPDLMGAMDVFVFPSKLEGLPVTLVEAQKSGLPCVISDTITKQVTISNLVKRISLSQSAEVWADEAISSIRIKPQYFNMLNWDICETVHCLERLYL